jgi:hypothetical protein
MPKRTARTDKPVRAVQVSWPTLDGISVRKNPHRFRGVAKNPLNPFINF